jgi:phosphorylcholine metabolism protein LicD
MCRESMDEIIDVLELHEIKPFPIGGSLLGLVRDGKFMDYDKDADIGIFVSHYDDVFNIVSILCKVTKFTATAMVNESKKSHEWNIAILDTQRNIVVDIFFFYREHEQIVEGVYTNHGLLKWAFTPFELIQQKLAGKIYWIPDNVDLFLTELYSDWRKPVEVWDSLVDCPNLLLSSQPVVLYFGLMRLWEALQKGKSLKALNYYEKLTIKWGMKFSAEADENIKKLLNIE